MVVFCFYIYYVLYVFFMYNISILWFTFIICEINGIIINNIPDKNSIVKTTFIPPITIHTYFLLDQIKTNKKGGISPPPLNPWLVITLVWLTCLEVNKSDHLHQFRSNIQQYLYVTHFRKVQTDMSLLKSSFSTMELQTCALE